MRDIVLVSLVSVTLGIIFGLVLFPQYEAPFSEQVNTADLISGNIGEIRSYDPASQTLIFYHPVAEIREEETRLHIDTNTTVIQRTFIKDEDGIVISQEDTPTSLQALQPGDQALIAWFVDKSNKKLTAIRIILLEIPLVF